MGRASAGGLLENGAIAAKHLTAYDVDPEKQVLADVMGITMHASAPDLARASDTLVLAVKPQSMDEAVEEIRPALTPSTLLVSIAAGISIRYLQTRLGAEYRVVRVMPNTPALVGAGAAGIAPSPNCSKADADTAHAIFASIGIAESVPESLIDAVTALSGSGPAYFFYLVECLTRAAVAQGLPEAQAARLASQTLVGAGLLLRESGEPASVLRERVTSKGGTTEAALKHFAANGFEQLVQAAVAAAVERSRELGQ
jgi:pyrroline-5-carboxylate reductase